MSWTWSRRAAVVGMLLGLLAQGASAASGVRVLALFKGKALLSIDGQRELLREGERSSSGVELVSATAARAVVAIGGERHELLLDDRIGAQFAAAPETVIRLLPGRQGHYFADGTINGHSVRFLVDTGATAVSLNKNTARSLGLRYEKFGRRGTIQTASGTADAYGLMLDEVKVQNLRLRRVEGIVVDGDAPSDVLLGQSFLNRVDIHREGPVLELRGR